MKIVARVSVETDCTVEITMDHIREAFFEAAREATYPGAFLRLINDVARIINAVDDDRLLAQLNEAQRTTISEFMRRQAERFEKGGA